MYYDSASYTYYRYNERAGQYEFHSQADMSQYEQYYNHQAAKQEKEARRAAKQAKRDRRTQKLAEREQKTQLNENKNEVNWYFIQKYSQMEFLECYLSTL